jgi:hypothetical protein
VTVMVETVVLALVSARLPVLSFAQPMYPQPGRSVGDRVELLLDEVVAVMTLVLSVLDTDVCLDDEDELELEETDPRSDVLLLEGDSVFVLDTEVPLDDEDEMELVTDDEMVESDVDRIVLELPGTLDDEGSTTSLAPQTPELLFPVPIALCI